MIERIDHIVLTTSVPDRASTSTRVLGMTLETFDDGRTAFRFGRQKINLHVKGGEFEPKAHLPVPGALDLCLIADGPLDRVIAHLAECAVAIVAGPVARTGAVGRMRSVYVRDPDLNLIAISEYVS
jgi:catechol 2,3-dioxygenase-like lactoylglutathione lyase family enzyme